MHIHAPLARESARGGEGRWDEQFIRVSVPSADVFELQMLHLREKGILRVHYSGRSGETELKFRIESLCRLRMRPGVCKIRFQFNFIRRNLSGDASGKMKFNLVHFDVLVRYWAQLRE